MGDHIVRRKTARLITILHHIPTQSSLQSPGNNTIVVATMIELIIVRVIIFHILQVRKLRLIEVKCCRRSDSCYMTKTRAASFS